MLSFVDVYRRCGVVAALRAEAARAPTPGRARTAAAGQRPEPAEARSRGAAATSWVEGSGYEAKARPDRAACVSALTKATRSRATWGALRHFVSVRSLRGFRAAGLATPGPRSLRLGSASRGNLGGRPTAVKRPRATKPHPPHEFASGALVQGLRPALCAILLRRCRPPSACCCAAGAPADRAPSRALNADPEVMRYIGDGRAAHARPERRAARRASQAHWRSTASACGARRPRERPRRVPGLRRPGRALVPARGAAGGRGRLAPGARRVGARARDRGRARRALGHAFGRSASRAVISIIDPDNAALGSRVAREARHAPRGRSACIRRTPPARLLRVRDFLGRCGVLRTGRLDRPAERLAYVRSRRGTESQRARPRGCEARRSEVRRSFGSRRGGEHPRRLGTASPSLRRRPLSRLAL